MASKYFDKVMNRVPDETIRFVSNSFDIIDYVRQIILERGINQKELAKLMGKEESEISKLLSPNHNLTLKTISKLESCLGEKIISTPIRKNSTKPMPVYFGIKAKVIPISSCNQKKSEVTNKAYPKSYVNC